MTQTNPEIARSTRFFSSLLEDIASAFASDDRATAVMACGTGKTFLALWAAERARPKTVLVLVPSLTLLKQTLTEWSEHTSWESRFSYLCVCSDQSVDLRNDEINIDRSDIGFRVDTDPAVVRTFLSRPTDDVKVIFSTYHSSPVIGAGSKDHPPFDFAVFDEAHKTTGRRGTSFSYALSNDNIRISKRLFLTATPRHIDIRHRDKEGELLVQSMDDPTVYGRRAHILSFYAAAHKGIICRYKVLISVIDKQMVDDFTRKNGITLVDGDEIATRWVANLIALGQAAKKVDAKKIISFHSRVATAREFASSEPRGIGRYLPEYDVRHVNGTQSSADRSEIIKAFTTAKHALLTNARCLKEGINIPTVDMVAFIDPRQSRIDIAQAVGRAMRKPRGASTKTLGYVLVPLFCGVDGESVEDAIKSGRFDGIASVVNALQENDEELVDIIRELKQRLGEELPFNPKRFIEKVEVVWPHVDYAQLTQSIAIEIADRIGFSWDEWCGRLAKYKQREGHCRVPRSFKAEDGHRLGSWVAHQRNAKDQLSPERRQRLDDLGFDWDPFKQDWEEGLSHLRAYKQREGYCRVPAKFKSEDGYSLGNWVSIQRRTREQLSPERRQKLDDLGFDWDPFKQDWEEGLSHLQAYKQHAGHCRVNAHFKTEDGYRLGSWVAHQRNEKDQLSPERRQKLGELGFVWDPIEQDWQEGFSHLRSYKQRERHCRVPESFKAGDGYSLASWVANQRNKKEELSPERRQRLDDLGFAWDPIEQDWQEGLSHLRAYKQHAGHCRVPRSFKAEDGYRLGGWVSERRKAKDQLSPERRRRLDDLGFAWDPLEQDWQEGLNHLRAYQQHAGHCRVPGSFKAEDGYSLGNWIARQRNEKDQLSPERRQKLDELGFFWDPIEQDWQEGLSHLRAYKQRERHCRVPNSFKAEDGYRLGSWVAVQRRTREQLSPERRQSLDQLGFVWDSLAQQWERGLSHLRSYKHS